MVGLIKIVLYRFYFLYKVIYLKRKKKVYLHKTVSVSRKTYFEGHNKISPFTKINNAYVGYGTYIGEKCVLSNVKIGRFCSLAKRINVITATHPTKYFVSTHPAFFSLRKQGGFTFVKDQLFKESLLLDNGFVIEIGNDVWIGEDVKLIGNIKIGDGAIIATGSVVTKNVEPYSIIGGIPSKLIRYRFKKEEIDFLIDFKWWEKSTNWIEINASYFSNIDFFLKQFSNIAVSNTQQPKNSV